MASSAEAASSSSSSTSSKDAVSGSDQAYRHCLQQCLAAMLSEAGFGSATPLALQSLTEILQAFLAELGRSSRAFTELAARSHPLPADVLLALAEMGFEVTSTGGLRDYAFRVGRRTLPTPATATASKQTSILHTGDRQGKQQHKQIPEHFPEFPDSHSYIRTPTHKQPVTEYENVREKAASQKRDVERALTRFIAKTGQTHSLFNTDDTNLFPLISCDRLMPDQPVLPSYISALLFKDQIFEEDEREFLPKAKKKKEEEGDEGDEGADGSKDSPEDGADANSSANADDKDKQKSKDGESDAVDNPYLRPVRVPRTPSIKRML